MPGLECRSCSKIVHASQDCSRLTAKQLSAIRNTDNLDWVCDDCQHDAPRRKSSYILPEDEEEEEEDAANDGANLGNCNIDTIKLLKNITDEMKRILKKELSPIETSLSFCCDKIDDLAKTVEVQNKQINALENKLSYLSNEKKHMELELGALKQYVRDIEQRRLENIVEITGIPKMQNENLDAIGSKLAESLKMDGTQITNIKRTEGRNGQDGNILMELKVVEQASMWVRASKNGMLSAENIIPEPPTAVAKSKVLVRRAMTKANKSLLWQAQQKLKPLYKYVWFQDCKILVRKGDNDKPLVIRSEVDVEKLLSSTQTASSATHR